ncbi:hypothetical protein DD237_000319 [Peronospora effusa]|uniref:DUF3752 domain-containing protein n=1 Tax=Peronospora effusa TaxID=542832 RepID=A0A425BWR9_9STRA|nr:hypothetical protein DD237_000319 [Peronospora effusa]
MGKHERDRDSSRLDERQKRHKKRHDNDKKKTKKSKKHKEKKSYMRHKRSHHSDSDSASDTPSTDYKRAMKVVQELLMETPEISKDLLQLFQMVDDGEVAVIGGIKNRRIRSKLKELFPLLGLHKLREPKDAFAKPRKDTAAGSLVTVFRIMLSGDTKEVGDFYQIPAPTSGSGDDDTTLLAEVAEPARRKPMKRELPIGPTLPPVSAQFGDNDVQDDDDDEVVGPALPGMKGFRLADERVEAEMVRKAKQLEKEQWERARDGGKSTMAEADGKKTLVREEWMTMMPESSILKDSLGPQIRPPSGKPAAKEPAAVDKTWFDSPEERERAKRAKLDMELLGYVRKENAPSDATASVMTIAPTSVNESILPNANPEADEAMRQQMASLRKARGPSLLEQHQRKQAEHANDGVSTTQSSGGWNRDRDLTARRGMSGDDAERMITAAKQINSKFTAPTISRQFL